METQTREDIDAAVTKFTNILKRAAHLATPATKPHGTSTYLPSKIKCIVALKRKARATWQKTHAPKDRRIFNNASNKLKTALHTLRNENFTTYVSSLSNSDHSVWKPIKSRRKPRLQVPQFGKIPHQRDHGPRVTVIKSSFSRAIYQRSIPPL